MTTDDTEYLSAPPPDAGTPAAAPKIVPRNFKGTRDHLPADMALRNKVFNTVAAVFERFGFEPLQTPALEYYDVLTGKYGEDERLIYRLDYKGGFELALRYDLTVPLARVMAQYPNLPKPFKRYQMQPVWRADRPQIQQGRFREFWQCDADIVGTDSIRADAELVALKWTALSELGFKQFTINVSSRKVIAALADLAGVAGRFTLMQRDGVDAEPVSIPMEMVVSRGLDKLGKIGKDGVTEELSRNGVSDDGIARVLEACALDGAPMARLNALEKLLGDSVLGKAAVAEVRELIEGIASFGVPESCYAFDIALARGLDYYTGPIFETTVTDPPIGSLSGGGRYDELIGRFGDKAMPATGMALGVERIVRVMEEMQKASGATARSVITAYVACLPETSDATPKLAAQLRAGGVRTDAAYGPQKLKDNINAATARSIRWLVIPFDKELEKQCVVVKDLESRTQETVRIAELDRYVVERQA
jgi:histidyl-tRNA synthetase